MADLIAFLNARLDEDEDEDEAKGTLAHNEAARARGLSSTLWDEEDARARRLLREVEAKRAIVEDHQSDGHAQFPMCQRCAGCDWPCETVRAVATVYSDHPDYDPKWKP